MVERAVNTGVISLKQTTAGNDATTAGGWALTGNHWKKGTSNSWSEGTTGALQAELRTMPSRRYGFRILNMELSGPGGDELYTQGEDLRITATLSEPAHIDRNRHQPPAALLRRGGRQGRQRHGPDRLRMQNQGRAPYTGACGGRQRQTGEPRGWATSVGRAPSG